MARRKQPGREVSRISQDRAPKRLRRRGTCGRGIFTGLSVQGMCQSRLWPKSLKMESATPQVREFDPERKGQLRSAWPSPVVREPMHVLAEPGLTYNHITGMASSRPWAPREFRYDWQLRCPTPTSLPTEGRPTLRPSLICKMQRL
jgi:hypothetical protein